MPFGRLPVTASRAKAGLDGSVAASSIAIFLLEPLALEGTLAALAFGLRGMAGKVI